jgi:hypothetical protein
VANLICTTAEETAWRLRSTMVARLFSSANADTISPALAVCSFTNSTTHP